MITMKQIEDVGRQIGEQFGPERVILFGSYAEGQPTGDSDVDLLVVMPAKGSTVDQSVGIRLAVRPPFPMDLLVRTPEKVRERLDMGDSFMRRILDRGRLLYEARHDSDFAVAYRYHGESATREQAKDAIRRCRLFRRVARQSVTAD